MKKLDEILERFEESQRPCDLVDGDFEIITLEEAKAAIIDAVIEALPEEKKHEMDILDGGYEDSEKMFGEIEGWNACLEETKRRLREKI